MNPVNWFEIPVKDMNRAKKFYSAVLNKELNDLPMPGLEMSAFPMIPNAPNSTGALIKAEGYEPTATGVTVYFACEDLDTELGRVEPAGGKIINPKTSIGEYGFVAHFIDTEGNRVALHSEK